MKKLLFYILLFTIPVLIWSIFSNDILPVTTWTYRTWEALRVKNATLPISFGPFYPNYRVLKIEQGDLAYRTAYSVSKCVLWETDELGYRNYPKTKDKPIDILLIGDSYIAGSANDQPQTLSEQIRLLSGKNVYQMAPSNFEEFDKMIRMKLIPKPKMIIYTAGERTLNLITPSIKYKISSSEYIKVRLSKYPIISNISVFFDRLLKNASYRNLNSRLKGRKGSGVQSPIDKRFFFFQGNKHFASSKYDYVRIVKCIQSYKSYCDSLGIIFVFFACPDKETVYYEYVPFSKQPETVQILNSLLAKNNINYVDALPVFNKYKKYKLLYHYDDTHWNAAGVSVIAAEIVKKYAGRL